MIDSAQRIKHVNLLAQHSLNKAAFRLLPQGWGSPAELPVLSLMGWALLNNEVQIRQGSPDHPSREQLESAVQQLIELPPQRAMNYLTQQGLGFLVRPDELNQTKSPREAARLLLEALQERLIEEHP